MEIGIFGGTFDPVHKGHVAAAYAAYRQFKLNEVWFMPAFVPPHKSTKIITGVNFRFEMLKIALCNIPYFKCSDFELKRQGKSYTCETVLELKKNYKNDIFSLIIGTDSLFEIETWKNPAVILKIANLIVASRDYSNENLTLKSHFEYLKGKYEIKGISFLDTVDVDISSTEIRELAKAGEDIGKYVPESVCRYIKEKKIYV